MFEGRVVEGKMVNRIIVDCINVKGGLVKGDIEVANDGQKFVVEFEKLYSFLKLFPPQILWLKDKIVWRRSMQFKPVIEKLEFPIAIAGADGFVSLLYKKKFVLKILSG